MPCTEGALGESAEALTGLKLLSAPGSGRAAANAHTATSARTPDPLFISRTPPWSCELSARHAARGLGAA
jgi:hypothetical protein